MRSLRAQRGLTLIDVIVGSALVLVVFMGLFGILRASLQVSGLAKVKAAATAVATSQMEYIRSLPYDDMGTLGGIPAGTIPQYASTTDGGLAFNVRTYIEYADDPADGLGASDATGITTDYKYLKVVVSYTVGVITRDVTLVSNASPKGIESTTGGGTLQVNVVDAVGAPVPGATVRIENDATSPTIDFSTFSDAYGLVYLPGAPTSTEYRITVGKTGYSTAETYERDATNANPTPGYLTVVAGSTTSGTFAIDELVTFILRTFSPIAPFTWTDDLNDAATVSALSSTQVLGGELILSGAPGSYAAAGSARSSTTEPLYLAAWTEASFAASEPLTTTARVSVADSSGALVPDAALSGNSTGFSAGTIDISGISTTTYPALRLVATLTSGDSNVTAAITQWGFAYDAGPLPLPDVDVELTGAKTIGTTSGGAPLYKTEIATTTDSSGIREMSLEWDLYTLSVPGYTVVAEDPASPYELLPGTSVEAVLILEP